MEDKSKCKIIANGMDFVTNELHQRPVMNWSAKHKAKYGKAMDQKVVETHHRQCLEHILWNQDKKKRDPKLITLICNQNIPCMSVCRKNAFFQSCLLAYNHHMDWMVSPDDVKLLVHMSFAKMIRLYHKKIASKVLQYPQRKKQTIRITAKLSGIENPWETFFHEMDQQIISKIKPLVAEVLCCKFSTTGPVESILSTACLMDCFSPFFDYVRDTPDCGIRRVHLLGIPDDWKTLLTNVRKMQHFHVPGSGWKEYIVQLCLVLEEFLSASQGKANPDYWDKILNIKEGSLGSSTTSFVSGWILKFFFGLGQQIDICDVPSGDFYFPIKWVSGVDSPEEPVYFIGGFSGWCLENNIFRPQQSFTVFHHQV